MAISTNQKPTIYRNLYENTGPAALLRCDSFTCFGKGRTSNQYLDDTILHENHSAVNSCIYQTTLINVHVNPSSAGIDFIRQNYRRQTLTYKAVPRTETVKYILRPWTYDISIQMKRKCLTKDQVYSYPCLDILLITIPNWKTLGVYINILAL